MRKPKRSKKTSRDSAAHSKRDYVSPDALYDVACILAFSDDTAQAFRCLEKAIKHGYRDCKQLKSDRRLKSLHAHKKWPGVLQKCKNAWDAYLKTINTELHRMCEQDWADQKGKGKRRATICKRNAERRKRVKEMLAEAELKVADDYVHAGWIFYHGPDPLDYTLARRLALKALKLDARNGDARFLAAASKDRYLRSVGKPQIYGTQFVRKGGKLTLEPIDRGAVTDEERKRTCGVLLYLLGRRIERSGKRKACRDRAGLEPYGSGLVPVQSRTATRAVPT